MNSYHDWQKLLYEMTENVRCKILTMLPKRGTMNHFKFKQVLDSQAQKAIIEIMRKKNVTAELVSEEGNIELNGSNFIITADPVDGTTNLSRGFKPSVTSISVSTNTTQNDVIAGIVTNIYSGETYYAEKEKGATLNGYPIYTANFVKYRHGLISMDISKVSNPQRLIPLIQKALHIRSEGCSANSLCQIASGILDAHIDLRGIVRATDISAGLLILKEAGGTYIINDEPNGNLSLKNDTYIELIAASNKKILDEINQIMKKR